MAGHVDDLKQRYEAFSNGDLDTAFELWADDFVWQGPNSTELPGGGERRGKDESVKAVQEAVGAWDEFSLTADEFLEGGDTVVVLAHQDVKKGDQSAQLPVVHIWRYSGDSITRLQVMTDTHQTAELLGMA
jgi:ketosteroid isomerase-like protein